MPPPEVKPYELPSLKGSSPHYNDPIPALLPAPKVDSDTIFNSVLRCYPEKSKFKIDLNLIAGVRANFDEYRLALVSMCNKEQAGAMNSYLLKVATLPKMKSHQ